MSTLESLIGATEFGRSTSAFLDRAEAGERLVILRNNKPAAMVIDVATAKRLESLDTVEEDLRLLSIALVRTATDSGRRFTLDEVLDDLDIVLDDEGEGE